MKIISVVGARPNFMKIAPFCKAIEAYNKTQATKGDEQDPGPKTSDLRLETPGPSAKNPEPRTKNDEQRTTNQIQHILVHTGQHYDDRMNRAFFEALGIPNADINLGIGSGSHAEQVGQTMIAFEKVVREHKPDWVVVVGDVNATCACSITAKKEHVKLAHIEAGLRSFDLDMPEEINRMVTDRLSDLLLTPCRISVDNLKAEGVSDDRIAFVGNIMIDTLEANCEKAAALVSNDIIMNHALFPTVPSIDLSAYALMTMHRPSNVDEKNVLEPLIEFLCDKVAGKMPLIWPIHPRARKQLEAFGLWEKLVDHPNVYLLHPLGYHEMLRLNMGASIMLTDSGGLQEECCVLGTPCLTLRWNTERPVTLREHGGASVLVGNNVDRLREEFTGMLNNERQPQRPELWDGHTAERIVNELIAHM